jgi:hypothetical protein
MDFALKKLMGGRFNFWINMARFAFQSSDNTTQYAPVGYVGVRA